MWHWLPPELRRLVLQCLSLPQLRLVKAVSRAMASDCRAVLRSKAWQSKGANDHAMAEELKSQLHTYRLPLTVSFFRKIFPRDAPCLATVHSLRLNRVNDSGNCLNADDVATWAHVDDKEGIATIVSDMCIEVHGHGICGSITALRQVLQEAVRTRGVEGASWNRDEKKWTTQQVAEGLWAFEVEADVYEEGGWSVISRLCMPSSCGRYLNPPEEMPTVMVLEGMEIVTEVRKGVVMESEMPMSMEEDFDFCDNANPLYLCRLGSKLFVR